jgi:hypothetical protein
MDAPAARILESVGAIVDNAATQRDLEHHGLELLAARHWRLSGRAVPRPLVVQERLAAARTLAAPAFLERIRAAAEGPILLFKGPEAARHYPDPALRPFRDLDVLVPVAEDVQRTLVAAGFEPAGTPELYIGIHHLRPLAWRGLPLVLEVHHEPKWVDGLKPPSTEELLEAAVASSSGVEGVLALPPAHHAVVLAAHAWAHRPLPRLRDLVDVALAALAADERECERLATAWGIGRLWRATVRMADALLLGAPKPAMLRLVGRRLWSAREPTVFEAHVESWLASLWCLPRRGAFGAFAAAVSADLRPEGSEGWPSKLARTRLAIANAYRTKSEHDEALEQRVTT